MRKGIIAAALAMMTIAAGANAELVLHYGHTGETRAASDLPQPTAEQLKNKVVNKSGTITFTATYLDPANVGFNDPTEGAARKQVVQDVFAYLNTIINETGTCDVIFEESLNNGASPTLASAGTLHFTAPSRFSAGLAFDHITTGVDPEGSVADIYSTFNFGHSWYAGSGTVPAGQYDMFSVLLHEIVHGLGISSLTLENGTSAFLVDHSTSVFTTFDDLLRTSPGDVKVWNSSTFAFEGGSLTGGDNSIRFNGTGAQSSFPGGLFPPIYTPNPYQSGSSVAHWQLAAPVPSNAVMRPSIATEVANRELQLFEVDALEDIGYALVPASSVSDWMMHY